MRDSLGVPIEPDEELPMKYTWDNEPVYAGQQVIDFGGDLIIDETEKLAEYVRKHGDYVELISIN